MKIVKCSEIADQLRGVSYKKGDVEESPFYNSIPVLRAGNIDDASGEIIFEDLYYLSKEAVKEYQVMKEGDILIAASSGSIDVVGKAAFFGNNKESTFGAFCKTIRPKQEKVHSKYLFYFFRSEGYRRKIKELAQGANINNIRNEHLDDLKVPLPSLSEQKTIVAKLDRAQRLIDIDKEMLAKYDELIQSVFLEMFGDPVTNPKGWEIKKLGDVGTLARGKSKHRPRNDPSILGGKYPLIQTGDVSNAGLFITDYDSTYNEQGLKQSKLWEKGTLCITIAANIAKVGILDFNACFPDSVVGFKSEQASSIFIYSWMGFLQDIIEEQAPVSAQKNINLRILRDLDIIFPPLELQRKYESAVLSIHSEREKVTEMNKKSEELFSSLVQEAFIENL